MAARNLFLPLHLAHLSHADLNPSQGLDHDLGLRSWHFHAVVPRKHAEVHVPHARSAHLRLAHTGRGLVRVEPRH